VSTLSRIYFSDNISETRDFKLVLEFFLDVKTSKTRLPDNIEEIGDFKLASGFLSGVKPNRKRLFL
jgi:hypothetical protein